MAVQAACRGGSFAVESVAAFAWNGWQASSGISGNLGLEYALDLGITVMTVKTRLFRARRHLKLFLESRIQGGFESVYPFDGARCAHMADSVVELLADFIRPPS